MTYRDSARPEEGLFDSLLLEGERLRHVVPARRGVILRASDAFVIPFTVLWAGFAVFWTVGAASAGAPWFFVLFGSGFMCVGGYMVIGRFFHEASRRAATLYAVTDTRVIVRERSSTRSLPLANLTDVTLDERGDGGGTISVGKPGPFPAMMWGWQRQQQGHRLELAGAAAEFYAAMLEPTR